MKSISRHKAPALVIAAAAALTTLAALPNTSRAEDLTVAVGGGLLGDAIKTEFVGPLKEKSGKDIVVDNRDWGIGAVRTRVEGGSNTWDVVTTEDIEVAQGCDEGLFAQIDKTRLPQLANYVVANDTACGVPLAFYSVALVYDSNKLKDDTPKTWADFWNVDKWPGRRSMYKSPRDSMEIALMADGVPREDIYKVLATPEGVERAFKKLDELKPHIVWWTSGAQARQGLVAGETVMVADFDSAIRYLNKNTNTNLAVVMQNAISHVDYWAVINDTPQLDNAYAFLDWASQPEPQAGVSNRIFLSPPNGDALKLVAADVQPLLSASPENTAASLPSNTGFWLENYEALNKRFETWVAR